MARRQDLIPSVTFQIMENGKPVSIASEETFSGRSAALAGLPGASTPGSHYIPLPSIVSEYESFKESGIDSFACTPVSDVFVMDAWRRLEAMHPLGEELSTAYVLLGAYERWGTHMHESWNSSHL